MTKYITIISLIGIMTSNHAVAITTNPLTACPTNYISVHLYSITMENGCASGSWHSIKLPVDTKSCNQIDTGHPYEACYIYGPANFNFYDDVGTWQFTSECILKNPF